MKLTVLAAVVVMMAGPVARAQSIELPLDFDGSGAGAALLVAHLPVAKQPGMQRSLEQLLTAYRTVETNNHVTRDEPAGALAAFVAGNMAASRHTAISDPVFSALVGQFRTALRAHPELARSLHVDRTPVVEQLEIVGMLMMATTLGKLDVQQSAAVEAAARHYLSSYLAVDAQSIELSDRGLAWTGAVTGPLAVLGGGKTTVAIPAGPDSHDDVAAQIELVGTHLEAQFVGVNYTYFEREVWMFKDGMCTGNMKRVLDAGIAADRRDRPKEWSKCRRTSSDIEEFDGKRWTKLDVYLRERLPKGFTLAGKFVNEQFQTSYGGAYAAWRNFSFDKTGRFDSGGGAGGGTAHTAVNSRSAPAGGTYSIDGYVLTLRYDDGHVERRSFFADAKKLDRVYINGTVYRR